MKEFTIKEAESNFEQICDEVRSGNQPVVITRDSASSVVLMSLSEFNSEQETAYLMQSPANARRLSESIAQLEQGKVVTKELADFR